MLLKRSCVNDLLRIQKGMVNLKPEFRITFGCRTIGLNCTCRGKTPRFGSKLNTQVYDFNDFPFHTNPKILVGNIFQNFVSGNGLSCRGKRLFIVFGPSWVPKSRYENLRGIVFKAPGKTSNIIAKDEIQIRINPIDFVVTLAGDRIESAKAGKF